MKYELENIKATGQAQEKTQWEAYQALISGKAGSGSEDVASHSLSNQHPILLNWTNAENQPAGNLRSSSDPSLQVKTD